MDNRRKATSKWMVLRLKSLRRRKRATTPDLSSLPPVDLPSTPVTPVHGQTRNEGDAEMEVGEGLEIAAPPPAFTPSINRTLNKTLPSQYTAAPLPAGLTIQELKTRLTGKKKIKYVSKYYSGASVYDCL